MPQAEPMITTKDNFRLKICFWVNDYDQRPYYSHALFENEKAVMVLPYLNKPLSIEQMIGMYRARQVSNRH